MSIPTPQQRLASLLVTCEHAAEIAKGGRQERAEELLAEFLADKESPYPPHAQKCGTCHAKAKVPTHSGHGNGVVCLNCGRPT